jgi:hypothetical protein
MWRVVCDIAQQFVSMFILLRAVRKPRATRNATIRGAPSGVRESRVYASVRDSERCQYVEVLDSWEIFG